MRALPLLEAYRRLRKEERYLDCESCQQALDVTQRRTMRCGWLPRSTWLPGVHWPVPTLHEPPSVCYGYSAQNPRVRDVALAWAWREKGSLAIRFPNPPPLLLDLIDAFAGSVCAANDWYLKESEQGARQRHA